MSERRPSDPHKEEDEGYLAAESGLSPAANPYPCGTIRYEEWRRGWLCKREATESKDNDGYLAAEAGRSLSENPYPPGTIRYEQWRRGWHVRHDESQRALRLAAQP
ncbi:MAG TPA: hypothetical protein VGC09_18955 [Rhodopila sp.]